MSRFSDIDVENQVLSPVVGYWNRPLVSIEEALQATLPFFNELDRSIRAAKKYCHFPSEHGLTHDESAAIYIYSMEAGDQSFYRKLNETLRLKDRHKIQPWFLYMKLLDTALNKLPTVKTNVWRGISAEVSENFTRNKRITWWSLNSCSMSTEVIQGFLPPNKKSTLFMIEAKTAKDISQYTGFPSEEEVLLSIGTELVVKNNALKHGYLCVVHLIEITNEKEEQLPLNNVPKIASDPKLTNSMPNSATSYPLSQKLYSEPISNTNVHGKIKTDTSYANTQLKNTAPNPTTLYSSYQTFHSDSTARSSRTADRRINRSYTDPPVINAEKGYRSMTSVPTKKVELCGGNACPNCGKCLDWYYEGDINRDMELYNRSENYNIVDESRWHRRFGANCVYTGRGGITRHGLYSPHYTCKCKK